MIIGYTQGTFDTLHYGHIRLLKNAKKMCDYLIVGVNSDKLVKEYKKTDTIIKEKELAEIVSSIKYADEVHIVESLDKRSKKDIFHFDIVFIGDDWKGDPRYIKTEEDLKEVGVKLVFLPYTKSISTTMIKSCFKKR